MHPNRQAAEHSFRSWDGAELFYRAWLPEVATDRAVILFHRGHEHSGRWQDAVDKLDLPDFALFAWDARGHGRSPGERGDAENLGALVRDVDAFVGHVSRHYGIPIENIVIFAHSVGSVLAATWAHDYAPKIRALVLGSPALKVRLYVPFAIPALRGLLKFKPKAYVNSYVKGRLLSHDPTKIESYNSDPLITRRIAVNLLVDLHDAGRKLADDAAAITTPTLVLASGADWVVDQAIQRRFFERLGSAVKEMHIYPGFFHDTFNERDNHLPLNDARRFILERFAQPRHEPSLLEADRNSATQREYERLANPLPAFSRQHFGYGLSRFFLKTVGSRLSQGVKLGVATGFDSGGTLDYVYRNRAEGWTGLGRWIDRQYLNAIGWRGIRLRKLHLEKLLRRAMSELQAIGQPVRIVDIAAGCGRYVLDAAGEQTAIPATGVLRDFSPTNVAAGQRLIAEKGLQDRFRFERGDAFDPASLAALPRDATVGVVSGLYELFPENPPVRASLAGLAEAVAPGGYLLYTGQPWHPQIEFIARVLSSHRNGQPWVMRRRSQQEMDQLVAAAGFEKLAQESDPWGIFTVSLARRLEPAHG
ncbi:MAG: bifunctional alpha/beta hydrolase/class I SAM-dependent methyltransferase [Candidatus Competibacteraceae bacterium]|nr:bifunctional alpha/beta hydrolase/class I SAM-dependent methyltransferase [Candidatus Competibacteraceae bacterium]